MVLRTVLPFASTHTFRASRDAPINSGFLGTEPTKARYFCAVYEHLGKEDLSKSYYNPKRKLGVFF